MDYSNKYVPKSLSEEDKKLQRKQLKKSADDYKKGKYTPRKKLKSFKSKTSNYILEVRKTLGVPIFRVSREIITDNFDALYAQLKPKGT